MAKPKRRSGGSTPKIDHAWFTEQFEDVGLSQRGAARELGIDASSLAHALYGNRKLQIQEAIDLARVLRLPLRQVLERAGYDLNGVGL